TVRAAARSLLCPDERLGGAYESTEESTIYLACKRLRIEPASGKERHRILRAVESRRLDARILEASLAKESQKFLLTQCARYASDPQLHVPPHSGRNFSAYDDVRHCESSTWLEHAV